MRVKSVKVVSLAEPTPVYDIEVPGTHNFKLENGPFVHNSKDVADALVGVIFGATMRRELWIMHSVSLREIPSSITAAINSTKNAIQDR